MKHDRSTFNQSKAACELMLLHNNTHDSISALPECSVDNL